MASPYRRRNGLVRLAKGHPVTFVTGIACAIAVCLEVGAVTGFFGLSHGGGGPAPAPANLNPHDQKIVAILAGINYTGHGSGYLIGLDGANLCAATCPELPTEFPSYSPPQAAVIFYYNVTNTANVTRSLSLAQIFTTGINPSLFQIEEFCCYSGFGGAYGETLLGPLALGPGSVTGFEGYAWTTVQIPQVPSNGYTVYVNFTSA